MSLILIINDGRRNHNEPILLPNDCGRVELTTECFNQLKKFPKNDYAFELIGLVRNNPFKTIEFWESNLVNIEGEQLCTWFQYAYMLQIIHKLDKPLLCKVVESGSLSQKERKLQILIDGNMLDAIDYDLKEIVFEGVLQGRISVHQRKYSDNSLQILTTILNPYLLYNMLNIDNTNISFKNFISNANRHLIQDDNEQKLFTSFMDNDKIDKSIKEFIKEISQSLDSEITIWKNNIEPWDILVEKFRKTFQDKWACYVISVVSANIKSNDSYEEFEDLSDNSKSLCKRVRCARMKSGNVKYWNVQLDNSQDITFKLLVLITWATSKTLTQLLGKISILVDKMDKEDVLILINSLPQTIRRSYLTVTQSRDLEKLLNNNNVSSEVKYIISQRFPDEFRTKYVYDNITMSSDILKDISYIRLSFLVEKYLTNSLDTSLLKEVKTTYSTVLNYEDKYINYYLFRNDLFRNNIPEIPIEIANEIMQEAKNYPRVIASYAERSCRLYANKNMKPVGQVAEEDKWFD